MFTKSQIELILNLLEVKKYQCVKTQETLDKDLNAYHLIGELIEEIEDAQDILNEELTHY